MAHPKPAAAPALAVADAGSKPAAAATDGSRQAWKDILSANKEQDRAEAIDDDQSEDDLGGVEDDSEMPLEKKLEVPFPTRTTPSQRD